MKRHRKKNAVVADINITPFTDVVLVLLIIFMITTPMLMQPGIKVDLPKVEAASTDEPSNIEILIDKNGRAFIGGKYVNYSVIEETIKALLSANPKRPVVIKGDKEVKYDYIIKVVDLAKNAGAAKFALAVDLERK
jgi:biopolymer transport protein ExbD